ncbi:MAG: sensor domain-containing diguanylate cyclase [Actinomycetes bacterium]
MAGSDRPTDPRLAEYQEFLARVAQDHLDGVPARPWEAEGTDDAVGVLGESIVSVTSGLAARFEQERQFTALSMEIAHGVYRDEVLNHIYASFRPIIPYDRIGCALLERDQSVLRARWAHADYEKMRLKVGFAAKMVGSSLAQIIETGQPRIINDLVSYLAEHPNSMSTKLVVDEGIRSSLTCPLVAMGRPIGFLFFSSREFDRYATVHQDMFTKVADLVSIAVEKGIVYEELAALNRDLTQARALLEYRATHDGLTGLLNHEAIIGEVVRRVDDEESRPYSGEHSVGVIMLDIDHFKSVNDAYGHQSGDQVLRVVADCLSSRLRASDAIGRYGGEEFLVVAESLSEPNELPDLAQRLRIAIERELVVTDTASIPVTISVGLATLAEPGAEDSASLIRRADQALYQAKLAGRNRVVVG